MNDAYKIAKSEWEQYAFDPATNGSQITTVRHVTHIAAARRIAEDGRVRSGLIYDESRLNTSRISVSWTSGNIWGLGSIYGTVEFEFDWENLVDGKTIYWVEAIASYRPPAFRFLLSKQTVSSHLIHRYDAASDNGPLKLVAGKWFRNKAYTSEFMIADDLLLENAVGLDFITHNTSYCSAFGPACEDRQKPPTRHRTGGFFLAYILAHKIHTFDAHFVKTDGLGRTPLLDTAYMGIWLAMSNAGFAGSLKDDTVCEAIVRGVLALYSMDQAADCHELRAQLSSKNEFEKALTTIVRKHFDLPTWQTH